MDAAPAPPPSSQPPPSPAAIAGGLVLLMVLAGAGIPFLIARLSAPERESAATPRTPEELYRAYSCFFCHGDDGSGPRADLRTIGKTGDVAKIKLWIKNPRAIKPDTTMPVLAVTDAEAAALAGYVVELARRAR